MKGNTSEQPQQTPSGVKPISFSNKKFIMIGGAIAVIAVGLGIGFFVSSRKIASNKSMPKSAAVSVSADEAGVSDLTNYKDTATGTLQKGGAQGEGTYHLDRPGGATQTVYLNSTVVDMSLFVGKKVQVWGQTQASKYAPWLMDVGKIKVVQ